MIEDEWYTNYPYWVKYSRATDVDDKIAQDITSNSDTMFSSDMMGSPIERRSANHLWNGKIAGGNITFNDGHSKWRPGETMSLRFEYQGEYWW